MNYLIISSYPPSKCGIGKYAYQMAKKLRAQGHIVNILSFEESEADFVEKLNGGFSVLKILKYIPFYEKIIIQYHESFFYKSKMKRDFFNRLCTHLAFFILFLTCKKIEVIIHEFIVWKGIEHYFESFKWFLAPKLIFHTSKEADIFQKNFFKLNPQKYEIRNPLDFYFKFKELEKTQARKAIGLSNDDFIFLCIGFIQPHKGFERAIHAFKRIKNNRMKLYIVGSLRIQYSETISYLNLLKKLAEGAENIKIIEEYLSDELFDTWLSASDCVIIPYRESHSSAVITRAKLFNKPVIAADTGGLKEQLSEEDILFETDEELFYILQEFSNYSICISKTKIH